MHEIPSIHKDNKIHLRRPNNRNSNTYWISSENRFFNKKHKRCVDTCGACAVDDGMRANHFLIGAIVLHIRHMDFQCETNIEHGLCCHFESKSTAFRCILVTRGYYYFHSIRVSENAFFVILLLFLNYLFFRWNWERDKTKKNNAIVWWHWPMLFMRSMTTQIEL